MSVESHRHRPRASSSLALEGKGYSWLMSLQYRYLPSPSTLEHPSAIRPQPPQPQQPAASKKQSGATSGAAAAIAVIATAKVSRLHANTLCAATIAVRSHSYTQPVTAHTGTHTHGTQHQHTQLHGSHLNDPWILILIIIVRRHLCLCHIVWMMIKFIVICCSYGYSLLIRAIALAILIFIL